MSETQNSEVIEIWKEIPGYEGVYAVSSMGRIKRVSDGGKDSKAGQILVDRFARGGYRRISLHRSRSDLKTFSVHHLVLLAFVGPKPAGMQTRHLDGNRRNNRLDNLLYGTAKENSDDRTRHGTQMTGEKNANAKLSVEDIESIRKMRADGKTIKEIAPVFGVHFATIARVSRGETWRHAKDENGKVPNVSYFGRNQSGFHRLRSD